VQSPTLVALDGAHNIRDLGGMPCRNGRRIAPGRLYRGCGMSGLSGPGRAVLAGMGLAQVIDLRSAAERAAAPGPFHDHPGLVAIAVFDGLAPLPEVFRASAEAGFADRYITGLKASAARFAMVFDALAKGPKPTLFHCSAGKDRTGLVAALLLDLLGVPRDVIVADYAATQRVGAGLLAHLSEGARQRGVDPALVERMMASHPHDMARVLEWIDQTHGSAAGYLRHAGVDGAALNALVDDLSVV
ncbi:MAG: tyrosine-protein phosphatase, partial [Pseudomonadota bacterium]|nr:tyrosine-protein phosphatase [Pseudomonadota bacterium]